MYIIHMPYVCMIVCIAINAILSVLNIAGCFVVDCVEDGSNTTCNNTISLMTPNGASLTFFLFVFVGYSEWSVCWSDWCMVVVDGEAGWFGDGFSFASRPWNEASLTKIVKWIRMVLVDHGKVVNKSTQQPIQKQSPTLHQQPQQQQRQPKMTKIWIEWLLMCWSSCKQSFDSLTGLYVFLSSSWTQTQ